MDHDSGPGPVEVTETVAATQNIIQLRKRTVIKDLNRVATVKKTSIRDITSSTPTVKKIRLVKKKATTGTTSIATVKKIRIAIKKRETDSAPNGSIAQSPTMPAETGLDDSSRIQTDGRPMITVAVDQESNSSNFAPTEPDFDDNNLVSSTTEHALTEKPFPSPRRVRETDEEPDDLHIEKVLKLTENMTVRTVYITVRDQNVPDAEEPISMTAAVYHLDDQTSTNCLRILPIFPAQHGTSFHCWTTTDVCVSLQSSATVNTIRDKSKSGLVKSRSLSVSLSLSW
ncbi:hypothetical protein QBC38DRAFT_447243 [Podospora fimiseda]|uniref:Uncharacterized protein n=1 Tax=Podospora fimiseda TaxID=252190 RepID=A0AAN7GXN3_9PEZI|nr:hypothetical protein QBC38DRAFT_447243 [Podospora fimiseda]